MTQRIELNKDDFAALVRGEVVTQRDLQVAIQDLNHEQMFNALADAIAGSPVLLDPYTFREDEEEVRRWIYGVSHSARGTFLEAFCSVARRADATNYVLLRPIILTLKAKNPQYRFEGAL